jgi:hypothetical protein
MDSAEDRTTGEVVSAEDLWSLDKVDQEGYVCRGCGAKVTPVAFRPDAKYRAHFRIGKTDHALRCDVAGEPKLIECGKRRRLSSPAGEFPVPYPSSLVLRDERRVQIPGSSPPTPTLGASRRATERSPEGHRRSVVDTIRPLCRHFLRYPYDRHLRLRVPAIPGDTYQSVFRCIWWSEFGRYPGRRLFYAAVRWSRPDVSAQRLKIMLDAGERGTNYAPVHGRTHFLCVEWSTWTEAKRGSVRKEFEVAQSEVRRAHADGTKDKAWAFFIGEQDPKDLTLFRVDDHRLVCCLVDEMIYPPRAG